MFAAAKEFPTPQRGGTKTSFILLDMASDSWFFKAKNSKTQHGDSFRKIMVENGVHLLGCPRDIYTDGCGSMAHVRNMAVGMGISCIGIPPHSQILNEAGRIADRLWSCARIFMISTGVVDSLFVYGMDFACYAKLRMATAAHRNSGATGLPPTRFSGEAHPVSLTFKFSRSGLRPLFTCPSLNVPKLRSGVSHITGLRSVISLVTRAYGAALRKCCWTSTVCYTAEM